MGASAYVANKPLALRPKTQLHESFGFDFAEDTGANQVEQLRGEYAYKNWVDQKVENSFLNRQYDVVRRLRETQLLGKTAENGILSKLEANGVDLVTIEKLLPLAEKLNLPLVVANAQQPLINGVAPLLIEPAPFLLPVIAGALEVGPPAFYAASAGAAAIDALLVAYNVEIPFVGLSAGFYLGLLLVPVSVITGGLGFYLQSLQKD